MSGKICISNFSGDADAVGLESKLRTTEVWPFLVSTDFAYDMAQDYTVASLRLSTPVPLHYKPGAELLSALGVPPSWFAARNPVTHLEAPICIGLIQLP